jgi:GH24 family phage-related lysozyme (muramidase)
MIRARWPATLIAVSVLGAACAGPRAASHPDRLTPGVFLDEEPLLAPRGGALRKVFPNGLALTKRSEGWLPHLYEDAARYCSIGYGHLVKRSPCDGGEPAEFLAGLTEARGAELLAVDLALAESAVSAAVTFRLTDAQYAALCDFAYNVGPGNFRRSTLLKVVNAGKLNDLAAQLRRWVKAGGVEQPGLRARREREIELFYEGRAPRLLGPALPPVDIRAGE